MIPGMSDMLGGAGGEGEAARRMKRVAFIFDSMTTAELDSDGSMFRDDPKGNKKAIEAGDKDKKGKGKGKEVAAKSKGKENVSPAAGDLSDDDDDDADEAGGGDVDPLGGREPNARVLRVARGSGTSVQEVEELLSQHLMFAKMAKRMGGKNGMCVDLTVFPLSFRPFSASDLSAAAVKTQLTHALPSPTNTG